MPSVDGSAVRKLVVACDAGMGSSVMLAGTLKKQLKGTAVTLSTRRSRRFHPTPM